MSDSSKPSSQDRKKAPPPWSELREGEDYTIDEWGRLVFTAAYHLKRGYCCGSGCRHCPYPKEAD